MQVPLEFLDGCAGRIVPGPLTERLICGLEQFRRFFGEDRRNLRIVIRLGRLFRSDLRRCILDFLHKFDDLGFLNVGLLCTRNVDGRYCVRELCNVIDKGRVIRALWIWPIDFTDDRRDGFHSGAQCVQSGLLETGFMIEDTAHESVQCGGNLDTTTHIRHVGAAMQSVTGTMQVLRNIERRRMALASIQIVVDDFQVTCRFLGKNIQQHRVHFKCRLFFLIFLIRQIDRQHRCVRIAFGKRRGARHQQVDVGARFGPNFELFNKFGDCLRSLQNEVNHWRRTHQCAIDQTIQQVLDAPAILTNTLSTHHASAALQRME